MILLLLFGPARPLKSHSLKRSPDVADNGPPRGLVQQRLRAHAHGRHRDFALSILAAHEHYRAILRVQAAWGPGAQIARAGPNRPGVAAVVAGLRRLHRSIPTDCCRTVWRPRVRLV